MNLSGETMAKRNAALDRAKTALAATRNRATDLRKNIMEKVAGSVGTGMLTVYAYNLAKEA